MEGQPEFAAWSPSRLCFWPLDTIRTSDFTLAESGKHPQMFGSWTVLASRPAGGTARDVALELFANSDRLIRSARLAGQQVQEARVAVGIVPIEDENGVPSSDKRFQVKMRKATDHMGWHLAGDAQRRVRDPWRRPGRQRRPQDQRGASGGVLSTRLLAADGGLAQGGGKDAFAKALKASPTRFAGPAYHGGGGKSTLAEVISARPPLTQDTCRSVHVEDVHNRSI